MKTKIKLLARLLMVTLLFSFMGCSEDVYENHTHSNSGKDEISFKQFISETGITKFDYYKKANVSNSTNIHARTIESEFITDTIGIKKYVNPIDNKTTYSFKIYPITEALESKEYYNLVYEKIGNEWNEIIFFNTEKSNPTDARKLESSEMVYNRISGREGFSEVIIYSIVCTGSPICTGPNGCDGFACPTGECIKTTIKYVYTGIQDTSSGFNGNPVAGNPSNTNPGGVGDIGNGIFIPNPYDGDVDTNNQAFLLAGQVAAFTNTLPTNLQSLISNYNFVYPYIVDFCRNNGAVVNQANKQHITNALNNFSNFQLNNTYNNLTNVNKDRFNFWAFYTFLNNNPLNVNNTKINDIKTFVQSAEFETANSIVDYLYENKESQEAIDFAEEMIDFYMERDWKAEIKQAISTGITSSAELTHKMYSKLSAIAINHPSSISYINIVIDGVRAAASTVIDTNPNTCNWTDLFNMWMFELGNNPLNFNGPSVTVTSLQSQQGVSQARSIALNQIANGNLNPIQPHGWTYGQQAFYNGMANGNIATSFLGSYTTNVTITVLPNGQHMLTFSVTNPSTWDSATRLRIDNNGDGVHDGIFPNHDRNAPNTLHIGGNFNQIWTWTETY